MAEQEEEDEKTEIARTRGTTMDAMIPEANGLLEVLDRSGHQPWALVHTAFFLNSGKD